MNQYNLPYLTHLAFIMLAFYVSTYIAGGFFYLAIGPENIEECFFMATFFGFFSCLYFLPILLIVSIIIWGITHPIKYFISFLLINSYGVIIPFLMPFAPLGIPTIILFFILLIWLTKVTLRHQHLRRERLQEEI